MFDEPALPDRFTIHLIGGPFDRQTAVVASRRTPPWWIYVSPAPDGGQPLAFHPDQRPPPDAVLHSLGARHNDGSYSAHYRCPVRSGDLRGDR
jgi:hypothetical protein